jgi:hypothetical protein
MGYMGDIDDDDLPAKVLECRDREAGCCDRGPGDPDQGGSGRPGAPDRGRGAVRQGRDYADGPVTGRRRSTTAGVYYRCEEKRIGALLGDIMDRFGTSSIGLGRAGMVEAPDGA